MFLVVGILGIYETKISYEAEAQEEIQVVEVFEAKTNQPEIEHKIKRAFPDNYEVMLAVARCESGLKQSAVSHTRDFGVMQINEAVWDGVANEMGLDYKSSIDDNIKMAQHIYEVQGISAWVCHNKNMHLAYLN